MQTLLILVGGEEIDKHTRGAPRLRTLWNEYFVEPWDCWSLGLNLTVPLNISNNQPIESWHNHGIRRLKAPLNNYEQIANIANYLYILEVATEPGACIPCEANPLNLICLCKIGRKVGVCKHLLFTTHVIMARGPPEERKAICNLKYMTSAAGGAKKGKGRAKAITLALQAEPANADDDNAPLQITW